MLSLFKAKLKNIIITPMFFCKQSKYSKDENRFRQIPLDLKIHSPWNKVYPQGIINCSLHGLHVRPRRLENPSLISRHR